MISVGGTIEVLPVGHQVISDWGESGKGDFVVAIRSGNWLVTYLDSEVRNDSLAVKFSRQMVGQDRCARRNERQVTQTEVVDRS